MTSPRLHFSHARQQQLHILRAETQVCTVDEYRSPGSVLDECGNASTTLHLVSPRIRSTDLQVERLKIACSPCFTLSSSPRMDHSYI